MARILSEDYIKALKEGILKKLLERIIKDDTLNLEFRAENKTTIYYRGRSLADVEYNNPNYKITVTPYTNGVSFSNIYSNTSPKNLKTFLNDLAIIKNYIDLYDPTIPGNSYLHLEEEYTQRLIRQNNSEISHSPYIFIDYQLDETELSMKPDAIAIKWNNKKYTDNITLSFIEVKNGVDAINGKNNVFKHIDDYINLKKYKNKMEIIKNDYITITKQKFDLGLINNGVETKNIYNLEEFVDTEFILVLANYYGSKLNKQIIDVFEKYTKNDIKDVYLAKVEYMGDELYDKFFVPINDYNLKLRDFVKPEKINKN